MRQRLHYTAVAILLAITWSSCLKDQCVRTFTMYMPVYRSSDQVRASMGAKAPQDMQNPGKIYVYGNYIFLNELDRGIHVIDNSNPASPQNISFIDIPGCVDMAVKGNMLYADAFTDLVVLDITNPRQATVKNIVNGVFPFRYYGAGIYSTDAQVVVDWTSKDTTMTVDCGEGSFFGFRDREEMVVFDNVAGGCVSCGPSVNAQGAKSPFGLGGSMARFAIVNNYLYTVGIANLKVVDISQPDRPVPGKETPLGWSIETIYPFMDRLFIGSNAGMYMFSIARPDQPQEIGRFEHARACDPVVGDDNYAFVTLRSGNTCDGFNNELDVVDIRNPSRASLLMVYPMKNPHGLSKDGNLLFICDGAAGLKIYDARNVFDLKLLATVEGLETYDVIAWNGLAIVTAKGGLFQYDYSDPANPKLLSKTTVPY